MGTQFNPSNLLASLQANQTEINPQIQSHSEIVQRYGTYEEYLDSQITAQDRQYIDNEDLLRQLIELGYRGNGDTMKRDEFESLQREYSKSQCSSVVTNQPIQSGSAVLISPQYDLSHSPFLSALAEREESILNNKLICIIFLRDINSRGQEISGYIDLRHRMMNSNFHSYYSGQKKLQPTPKDLSFYNWATQQSSISETENFQIKTDSITGVEFKNKRDRKIIKVDPDFEYTSKNGGLTKNENATTRTVIETDEYLQCVFYDRSTRYH